MKPRTIFAIAVTILCAMSQTVAAGPRAFDVAEDLSRFVFAESPVFDDGMPAYGNVFVTEGYIYPAGTLDGGIEGTLADGSPAFPKQVIGTWVCDGVFVGNGMRTTTGTILISRQTYVFNDGDILISHGPELVDVNVPFDRVVAGGTGDYSDINPVQKQTLLGMTEGYGVRLQIELEAANTQASFGGNDTEVVPAVRVGRPG